MSQQLDMFAPKSRLPAARHDPATSKLAAEALEKSGERRRQELEVLRALIAYVDLTGEGPTSAELGSRDREWRYRAARRLPDCADKGWVERRPKRVCQASGREAITWWPTSKGREAVRG